MMDADSDCQKMQAVAKDAVEEADEMETEDRGSCCCCGCYGNCCRKRHRPIGKRGKRCVVRFGRLFLISLNLLFVVGGLCLTGVGLWIKIDPDSVLHLELLRHLPTVGPLIALERFPDVVISIGCSIAILSLIGCCGACAENSCCLCLYAFFLVVVLTTNIVLVIIGFAMRDQISLSLGNSMQQQIVTSYNSSSVGRSSTLEADNRTFSNYFTRSWDTIQIKFNCCGSVGPEDYQSSGWFNRTRLIDREAVVPASCCHLANRHDLPQIPVGTVRLKQCQKDAFLFVVHRSVWDSAPERKTSLLKTQGCQKFICNITQRNISIIAGVICALVILQIADFIFACALLRYVRRRQDEIWFGRAECDT